MSNQDPVLEEPKDDHCREEQYPQEQPPVWVQFMLDQIEHLSGEVQQLRARVAEARLVNEAIA